jgi:hypothetical protein
MRALHTKKDHPKWTNRKPSPAFFSPTMRVGCQHHSSSSFLIMVMMGFIMLTTFGYEKRNHIFSIRKIERSSDMKENYLTHRKQVVDGRKLINEADEVTKLETGSGTHYAYVWVGTPSQRQTLWLDTLVFRTAFPCDPCTSCGNYLDYHESGPFEPDDSSTCTVTSAWWVEQLPDGDSYRAHATTDVIFIGGETFDEVPDASASFSLDSFQFGCMYELNGKFETSEADGVMGLAMHQENMITSLYNAGLLDQNAFSLCFGNDGGAFAIGGSNEHLHNEQMEYAYLNLFVSC